MQRFTEFNTGGRHFKSLTLEVTLLTNVIFSRSENPGKLILRVCRNRAWSRLRYELRSANPAPA
jgi:hypothetical protein